MIRPGNAKAYDELDLKLGIKSSLPKVKSTLALSMILWEITGHPSELVYSKESGNSCMLADSIIPPMISYVNGICKNKFSPDEIIKTINGNQLFKSQLESLIVAFELVWKLAKVSFVDSSKPASAERTGGNRYAKKLCYTCNIDLIYSILNSDPIRYNEILLHWVGFDIQTDLAAEENLLRALTALSEVALYKLKDEDKDIVFNNNSVYSKLIECGSSVDINGDVEAKGSLRILKSSLSEKMNPYILYSNNGSVNGTNPVDETLENYQKRVEMYLRLSATKVIGLEDADSQQEGFSPEQVESQRISTGVNVLLYGVPGSGKSWTIEHEYCKKDTKVERLVFHPDYTYADFVGQILPSVDDKGQVSYKFTAGPFTNILKDAYEHPKEEYVLVIEEINRGNAPAIFGDVFQLLDRKIELGEDQFPIGTSAYGITNANIAGIVYNDAVRKVRIPSNLSIIGTMNTSDQNVFTLDTAFQRRWQMRLIENNFENVRDSLANAQILDTGVTWKKFCSVINKIIVGNKVKMASAEDKRLGVYFVHENDLRFNQKAASDTGLKKEYNSLLKAERDNTISADDKQRLEDIREALMQNRIFPAKVIKYLWDDAFKFNPEAVFDTSRFESLEDIIATFLYSAGNSRLNVFNKTVRDLLTQPA